MAMGLAHAAKARKTRPTMNARRKPRVFADHKPPLVAFVLVAITSMVLLVHVARSDAAPGWLRQGVAGVVAGGAPLSQTVVSGSLLERAPVVAAEPPVATAGPAVVPAVVPAEPPATDRAEEASTAGADPVREQGHAAAQSTGSTLSTHDEHTTAGHADPAPTTPSESSDPSASPEPSESPSSSPNLHGARGDDVAGTNAVAGDTSTQEQADDPVRGAGESEDGQHPWYGQGNGQGNGQGKGQGKGHGEHRHHRGHGHAKHGHAGHGHAGHGHGCAHH